jgi:hypothetical protein
MRGYERARCSGMTCGCWAWARCLLPDRLSPRCQKCFVFCHLRPPYHRPGLLVACRLKMAFEIAHMPREHFSEEFNCSSLQDTQPLPTSTDRPLIQSRTSSQRSRMRRDPLAAGSLFRLQVSWSPTW